MLLQQPVDSGGVAARMQGFVDARPVGAVGLGRVVPLRVVARRQADGLLGTIELAFVVDKPWSGYNWYLGNAKSLVEINVDLPLRANAMTDLTAHEGYPGHHTEHSLKDRVLYQERSYAEHAIHLINTQECVISEGIGTVDVGERDVDFAEEARQPSRP